MLVILGGAMLLMLAMVVFAFRGPSAAKAVKRRLELLKERHGGTPLQASAQAQIRKLMAQRQNRVESAFSSLIPKPALMRLRLERTGRSWTLGRYAMVCC